MIDDGKDGLLIEAGNAGQLAGAMSYIHLNQDQAISMGQCGWEKVRRTFNSKLHYDRIIEMYKEVIDVALHRA